MLFPGRLAICDLRFAPFLMTHPLYLPQPQPGTPNREPGTLNREPLKEPGTVNREPFTLNPQPGTP